MAFTTITLPVAGVEREPWSEGRPKLVTLVLSDHSMIYDQDVTDGSVLTSTSNLEVKVVKFLRQQKGRGTAKQDVIEIKGELLYPDHKHRAPFGLVAQIVFDLRKKCGEVTISARSVRRGDFLLCDFHATGNQPKRVPVVSAEWFRFEENRAHAGGAI